MLNKYTKEILLESEFLEARVLTFTLKRNYLPLHISCFHTPPSFLACVIATFSCSSSTFLCASVCCLTLEGWLAFSPPWELLQAKQTLGSWCDPSGPLYKAVMSRVTLEYDRLVIKQFNRWKNSPLHTLVTFNISKYLAPSYKYTVKRGLFKKIKFIMLV